MTSTTTKKRGAFWSRDFREHARPDGRTKTIQVPVTPAEKAFLLREAARRGTTMGDLMLSWVMPHLEGRED